MSSTPPASGSQGVELLTIDNVRASQSYNGEEVTLGLGTLRALLVAISLDHPDQSANPTPTDMEKLKEHQNYATDLWLVLAIGDNFSLPIPAFQSIRPERINGGATSYVMPSHEIEGASIRIALPAHIGRDETKHFEDVLAQYAAYHDDDSTDNGTIELVDDQGHVLGVVKGQFQVDEDDALSESGHEKDPVLIDLNPESQTTIATTSATQAAGKKGKAHVGIASQERIYEKGDWMLKGADFVSRNIVKGSEFLGSKLTNAADSYTSKSPAAGSSASSYHEKDGSSGAQTPTREHVKIPSAARTGAATLFQWSGQAVQVSARTTGTILQMAANVGDKVGKKAGIQRQVKPDGTMGPAPKGIRGFVNRSLIATNTVLDGIDAGVQNILYTGGDAAAQVVGHRYGEDAKSLSENVAKTGKNVWVCYKDIRGVRRSALLKAAGGRVLKAQLPDGREVTIDVDADGHATTRPDGSTSASVPTPAPSYGDEKKSKS